MVVVISRRALDRCGWLLAHLLTAVLAFNLGTLHGFHRQSFTCRDAAVPASQIAYNYTAPEGAHRPRDRYFPSTISRLFAGASTADLDSFVQVLPLGAPLNGNKETPTRQSSHVVMLYTTPSSLPNSKNATGARQLTRNCAEVKQIVVGLGSNAASSFSLGSCVAIVGRGRGAESFHIQKWMRDHRPAAGAVAKSLDERKDELNAVGRYQIAGEDVRRNVGMRIVPFRGSQVGSRRELQHYFSAFDSALEDLRPLAESVANAGSDKVRGTIIVLVTNSGHSVLLRNYACAARAVGMDTSKILVFATDRQTLDVGKSLGLATFYHEQLFAGIPEGASVTYGDFQYSKIVMTKTYCVHLGSQLGYSMLFQDVDIVPYKANLLEWWIDKASSGYDLYFQYDCNIRPNYSPWIANSGSYFAVNNVKTKYFFASMVFTIDIILSVGSHQAAMHAVLNELSSLYGLRIKTLQKENEQLPIGFHLHRRHPFMKAMLRTNKTDQIAFHMNWNENAGEKIRFLQQMGDWYVPSSNETSEGPCLGNAMVQCHYRDIPSIVPCRDSPAFRSNRPSFW